MKLGKVRALETAGNLFSSAAERVANQKWTVKKEWFCSDSEKSPKDSNLFLPLLWNSYLKLSKSLESLLLQVTDIILLPLWHLQLQLEPSGVWPGSYQWATNAYLGSAWLLLITYHY